jgi:hypothetical protein
MKLHLRAFAVAAALWWGAIMFVTTWWLILWEGVGVDPGLFGRIYPGYRISPLGSVVGLAWGLVDGAVSGAILAWLYNRLSDRWSPREESDR